MACSLKTIFYVSGSDKTVIGSRAEGVSGLCPSIRSLQFAQSRSRYIGKSITLLDQKGLREWTAKATARTFSVHAQASKGMTGAVRWWENRKILKSNMTEVHSAQVLVESLLNAGDKLIIVEFYSPGCGGCQALHPKICELAESNPKAIFLRVNCEQLRTMCCSLHIPVVPFFRFYRGAEGRLCSFSCTNATIKKFKDALAKHGTEKCNMGPAKGLDESELLSLASVGEITIESKSRSSPTREAGMEDLVLEGTYMYSKASNELKLREGSAILMA